MNMYGRFLPLLLFLFISSSCKKDDILLTEDTYTRLTIHQENFPDFSFAGYERSEKSIPLVPVRITLEPEEGDDSALIQAAIDSVSSLPLTNGFRGAVLLKAGTYEVEDELFIRTSGVILRGEGQGEDGTVIILTSKRPYKAIFRAISITGSGSGYLETHKAKSRITAETVKVGATSIQVANAGSFSVGDTIVIVKSTNPDWFNYIGMSQYGWSPAEYQLAHSRIIKKIAKNTILFDIPMVDAIEQKFGGGYVTTASFPGRIKHCGVENIRMVSVYEHDEDEDHARTGVYISRATNSWVRNVTAQYLLLACVEIAGDSDFNTVQDCALLDPKARTIGGRKYSFFMASGTGNLFQRCYSRGGRHDFATTTRTTGPNVFLDCYATNTLEESGPHARWATGILFDNVYAGRLAARNRKALGVDHGWAGAQNMFWNCKATEGFMVESPPGAVNWCIGCQGGRFGDGYWASWGIPVLPRSFFIEQLENRLGASAVADIVIPAQQQDDNIWSELEQWAGDGNPLSTIQ